MAVEGVPGNPISLDDLWEIQVADVVDQQLPSDTANNDTAISNSADVSGILVPSSPIEFREIVLKRSCVMKGMIHEFMDPNILKCHIMFALVDDHGNTERGRGTGVTREVLSLFWKDFAVALTIGATEKVPSIRHDYQRAQWQSVARIICFGFAEESYFPLFLSRAFITACLYGEDHLSKKCLIDSFMFYVSKDERETMMKCLEGSIDVDEEDVMDLLTSYKCFRRVTKENVTLIFEELAHQELIQKPKYIGNVWSEVLNALKQFSQFKDFESLSAMYAEKVPTPKRIIKIFQATPSTDAERECYEHLKRYVKSLDDSMLAGFLQFVTGSNVITTHSINIEFNATDGNLRSFVAHTCSPMLEVPSTFQSYNEMSEELTNTLRNSHAWDFVIV